MLLGETSSPYMTRHCGCAPTAWWSLVTLCFLSTAQVSTVEWRDETPVGVDLGKVVEGRGHPAGVWQRSSTCLTGTKKIALKINLDEWNRKPECYPLYLTPSSYRTPRICRRSSNHQIYFKQLSSFNSNTATARVFKVCMTLETYQRLIYFYYNQQMYN
jgi:hypothetical protein